MAKADGAYKPKKVRNNLVKKRTRNRIFSHAGCRRRGIFCLLDDLTPAHRYSVLFPPPFQINLFLRCSCASSICSSSFDLIQWYAEGRRQERWIQKAPYRLYALFQGAPPQDQGRKSWYHGKFHLAVYWMNECSLEECVSSTTTETLNLLPQIVQSPTPWSRSIQSGSFFKHNEKQWESMFVYRIRKNHNSKTKQWMLVHRRAKNISFRIKLWK